MEVYNGSSWVKFKSEQQLAREQNPQTEQAIARRQQGGSVPAGSFGISKAGREQAQKNRQERARALAAQKPSGSKPSSKPSSRPSKPERDRMPEKSGDERMASWARANRTMIEKSGTKSQKAILKKALSNSSSKPSTSKPSTSSRPQRGGDGAPGAQPPAKPKPSTRGPIKPQSKKVGGIGPVKDGADYASRLRARRQQREDDRRKGKGRTRS